jgi:FKBP-type peptidyl-prolyl cis-trans isomerase
MKRIALITLLLAGCTGGTAAQTDEAVDQTPEATIVKTPQETGRAPTDVKFASQLAVDLQAMSLQESGLYIQVLREGEGPQAAPGDELGVHYTVWVSDGSKLDSSFDHQPPVPLSMVLGRTRLIDGWTEGVTGMRLGEKRRLVVPYQLGYGANGRPPQLPGYATLVFEVELASHTPAGG